MRAMLILRKIRSAIALIIGESPVISEAVPADVKLRPMVSRRKYTGIPIIAASPAFVRKSRLRPDARVECCGLGLESESSTLPGRREWRARYRIRKTAVAGINLAELT